MRSMAWLHMSKLVGVGQIQENWVKASKRNGKRRDIGQQAFYPYMTLAKQTEEGVAERIAESWRQQP